jgi:dolichol-phosphate mannosyltransferase
MKQTLSIVIPCLNEEENIKLVLEQCTFLLDKNSIIGELIVINDGSTDNTPHVVSELMATNSKIRLINHEKSRGLGGAFWRGVKEARYDFVIMMPGDNENDLDEALDAMIMANHVDIIVPFVCNKFSRSFSRILISSLFNKIINLTFGLSLNYTNGTVIYNRRVLLLTELESNGFFYQAELLVKLIKAGYLFAEIPVFLSNRPSGESKALSLQSLLTVIKGFFRLAWRVNIAKNIKIPIDTESNTFKRMKQFKENSPVALK